MPCNHCSRKITGYMIVDQYSVNTQLSMGWCLYGEPIVDILNSQIKQAMVQYQSW